MEDAGASSLLSQLTRAEGGRRGNQLPCCEDAQAALWRGSHKKKLKLLPTAL